MLKIKDVLGRKNTKIISHKALKQDIRCTCTERDETKAFKRVSLHNVFVGAKFHISIIKAPLLEGGFGPAIRFATRLWNNISTSIQQSTSIPVFKSRYMKNYFSQ